MRKHTVAGLWAVAILLGLVGGSTVYAYSKDTRLMELLAYGGTLEDVAEALDGSDPTFDDVTIDSLDCGGVGDFAGNFTVATNKFTVLATSGNVDTSGTLTVDLTSTLTGQVSAADDVTVGGVTGLSITLDGGDLFVADDAEVQDDFRVDGDSTLAGSLDANGGADVGGAALNCSFAGDALTTPAGSDVAFLGYVAIGNDAATTVVDGTDEQLYVEGQSEFDGTINADGLIDADLGITVTGAASTINHDSNFTVGIGTGTTTAAVTIGGGSNTVAIASTGMDVSTAGAVSGVTTLNATGAVTLDGAVTLGDAAADAITVTGALEVNSIKKWDNIATKDATYNPSAATTDGILLMNTSSGAFTYTIPDEDCDAAADVGRHILVKCIGSCGAKPLTIDFDSDGSHTGDGAATATINTNYGALNLLCGAADTWHIH